MMKLHIYPISCYFLHLNIILNYFLILFEALRVLRNGGVCKQCLCGLDPEEGIPTAATCLLPRILDISLTVRFL